MEHKDVTINIHVAEDSTDTIVNCTLDLRGDHFEASGAARRNPADPPRALIGEELAVARALGELQHKVMQAAQDKIAALEESISSTM